MALLKIVLASDTHTQPFAHLIPKCDIFIHAGDFSSTGSLEDLLLFKKEMMKLYNKCQYKYFIAGNHDKQTERWSGITRQELKDVDCTYLFDEVVEVAGIKIFGTPYSKKFGNWGFGRDEEGLEKHFKIIPEDIDIVVAHGPAYGVLDRNVLDRPCGSTTVLKHIVRAKPKMFVFGHIHEGRGHEMIGETHGFNATLLDERYQMVHNPIIVNYDTDTKKVIDFDLQGA